MALFIISHQHDAEHCPARDPYAGASLLNHLTRANARQHGIQIQAEAVAQHEHALYLIVESVDEERARAFFKPLEGAGQLAMVGADHAR